MRVKFLDLSRLTMKRENAEKTVEVDVGFFDHNDNYETAAGKILSVIKDVSLTENTVYCFSANSNGNEFDDRHFAQLLVNLFLQNLITNEDREREARMSCPVVIKTGNVIQCNLMNKKTKINKFSIQVAVNGDIVYKF